MCHQCITSLSTLIICCKYLSTVCSSKPGHCSSDGPLLVFLLKKQKRNTRHILPIQLRQMPFNYESLRLKNASRRNVTQSAAMAQEDRQPDWMGLSLLPHWSLGKRQPSGCWQADLVWWGVPCVNMLSPRLPGEHCALCWWARRALGSPFQQKQEVRIGGFLLPGPFFPPSPTQSQTQTMCARTLWTSAYSRPGWLVGKYCGRLNNMWSQETFSPSLLPLLFESLLCITPLGSLGKVVSDSSLCLVSKDPPPRPSSELSFRVRHTMDVIGEVQ